jgi:hypothetical protein
MASAPCGEQGLRKYQFTKGGKLKTILGFLLLLFASSAFGSVSFVQATPVAGGAGTSVTANFGSSVTAGDAICLFLAVENFPSPLSVTVSDPNASVYTLAASVPRGGFLAVWCTADALGSPGSVTASFSVPTIARAVAIEYSGNAGAFSGLIGNSATLTGSAPCGIPAGWGFTYNPCPTTGPTAMTTGGVTVQAGSLVAIFGGGLVGTPTVSTPWTSRATDSASLIELADQSFSSLTAGVTGAMSDPATNDRWGLLLLELRQ